MGLLSRITSFFRAKAAPAPYSYGFLGGPGLGGDAFHKHRPPNSWELLAENVGTAYACATLNSDLVASNTLRLYVRTNRGEPTSKMSRRGETKPVSRKTLEYLRRNKTSQAAVANAKSVEEVLYHPSIDLLNKPNPLSDGVGLSMYELFNAIQLYQEVIGRAYLLVEREGLGGTPSALWILASQHVRELCDGSSDRIIDAYEFAGQKQYKPDNIIPFRMTDLGNVYMGGQSPLRSCIEQVRMARKLDAHTGALLDNQARPDGLFIPKQAADGFDIGEREATRLAIALSQRFRTQGRGGIMVAQHDGQLVPLQWPTRDIADLKQIELSKVMIMNAFSVPSSKLDRNDANLASAQTGDYAHAKDAGVPRCRRNEAVLTNFYLPMWDDSGRLFFAYDSPVPEDDEAAREDKKVLISARAITKNELREAHGMERLDDGDVYVDPSNKGGSSDGADSETDDDGPDPAKGQAGAVATGDLKATVGGSQAILALQEGYYAGDVPRDAAIANAVLVFGFTPEEADQLFPEEAPDAPGVDERRQAELDAMKPTVQQPAQPQDAPKPAKGHDSGQVKAQVETQPHRLPWDKSDKKTVVGNIGADGLAGPLPQGRKIAVALRRVFAAQRKKVLKEIEGKAIEDIEGKLIEAFAAAGKTLDGAGLHAWLRIKNDPKHPKDTEDLAAGIVDAATNLPTKLIDLAEWDKPMAEAVAPAVRKILMDGARETIKALAPSIKANVEANGGGRLPPETPSSGATPAGEGGGGNNPPSAPAAAPEDEPNARVQAAFDVVEKNIPKAVEQLSLKFAESTNATTSMEINEAIGKLRDELTAGLMEGDTRTELRDRVKEVFDRASNDRAETIARTEASRARHVGEQISAKASGLKMVKRWLASADACDACLDIAEETSDGVPIDQPFTTTTYGDVDGPPLHPNCQCSETMEAVEGEGGAISPEVDAGE